jgi:hypothetical protein
MARNLAQSELMDAAAAAARSPARVRFDLATVADDAEIRRLLRENPMPGRIGVSLEREPDVSIAAAVEGDVHHTIVARDPVTGRLIATGGVSVRERYANGEPTRVGYLGQLRLDHRCRPRASVILGGFARFRELHQSLGVKLYLTSIAEDNLPARRLLERCLPGMPTYRPLGTFVTSLFPPQVIRRGRRSSGVTVREVGQDRLPQVLVFLQRHGRRFQYAPVWTADELLARCRASDSELEFAVAERGGRIVGCIGSWCQSAYKQAVVRSYAPAVGRWRRVINVFGRPFGIPRLPSVGTPLNLTYLSHLAVNDDDDPSVFAALLRYGCSPIDKWMGEDVIGYYVLGLDERHPLFHHIPRSVRRHTYRTTLYAVHWEDGRAAAEALDGRPCHPEAALL